MIPVRVVMKIGGKLHAAELLVAAISFFLDCVSQEGRGNKGLNAYDFVPVVDRALDPELSHRISENVPVLSSALIAIKPYQVLRSHRALEKTVRVEPDLELPCLRSGRLRICGGSLHV